MVSIEPIAMTSNSRHKHVVYVVLDYTHHENKCIAHLLTTLAHNGFVVEVTKGQLIDRMSIGEMGRQLTSSNAHGPWKTLHGGLEFTGFQLAPAYKLNNLRVREGRNLALRGKLTNCKYVKLIVFFTENNAFSPNELENK